MPPDTAIIEDEEDRNASFAARMRKTAVQR